MARLLHQANCLKENREVVEREDGCLAVSLDRKSQCLRLRQIGCTDTALCFTCKDGELIALHCTGVGRTANLKLGV